MKHVLTCDDDDDDAADDDGDGDARMRVGRLTNVR